MNMRTLLTAAGFALAATSPSAAQTVLQKAVVSAGGGSSASASARLDATVGEAVTGIATNGTTVGQFGFWAAGGSVLLSVERERAGAITAMRLAPNPAAEATQLTLSLAAISSVELSLHDATGRAIFTRDLGLLVAGEHSLPLDLAGLASGAYSLVASIDGAMLRMAVAIVR